MKRYPTHPILEKLNKGSAIPYLNNVKRFRVRYRYRPWNSLAPWTESDIEMVCRNEDAARYRTIQQVRGKQEVEVMRVIELEPEQAIQTGRPVTTASQKDYRDARENELDASEEERKDALRKHGLWVP